jgi:hypothetical protein
MNDELERDIKKKAVTYFKAIFPECDHQSCHPCYLLAGRNINFRQYRHASRRLGAIYALVRLLPSIT